MTIELFFSNQLEHLAEKLAQIVAKSQHRAEDPFLPLKIIIPNTHLAKWLTLMLARWESIVMNVDFQFLEIGLWHMLAAFDTTPFPTEAPQPVETPLPPEMVNKSKACLLILAVLARLEKNDPDLAPVTGYLFDSDGRKHPDYPLRLWQLSQRLGHLFQEYEYHRTDMIRQWMTGRLSSDNLERCEQRIYLATIEARTGEPVFSLMEYADHILASDPKPEKNRPPTSRVHVFGLSQVSAFHLSVIDRLAPFYQFYIYALNPSREFWEDIRTPAEKRWIQRKDAGLSLRDEEKTSGELFDAPDHPLLAAWGKPGRESVRLLCRLTDYSFQAGFAPVGKIDTVLKAVQNDILTLGTDHDSSCLDQDHSLQIYGCPGTQREVETVYQSILFNLSHNDHLQLTDVAVLVPDIAVYKPVFERVFNRLPKRLSYNLVDSRATIESVYGEAILGLLSLAAERFSRKTVFELILNPCFRQKWHLKTDEVRIWVKWAESLNIFHSFERSSSMSDAAPPSGRYTWKQGLQRLRLARIFSGNAANETETTHFKNLVPFADPDTSDTDLLEKFCLVVEALSRAADTLRLGRATAGLWQTALKKVSHELLAIPPDYRGEAAVRMRLHNALDEFSFFDRLQRTEDPPLLDATLVTEYLRFCLGAISGGSGDYLTGGVTVSELQPMRPIPFKVMYVLGMQEGSFPGRAATSALDLRLKQRRIGDISLPERNRYLFLETLLAAREKLYISYVSRDLQKDRLLPPCQVVNRLKAFIEKTVLAKGASFQLGSIPLKSSSLKYLQSDAVATWSDVRVNADLMDRVAAYRSAGCWADVQSRLGNQDEQRLLSLNPDFSIDRKQEPSEIETAQQEMEVQIERLARFLEKPLNESIRSNLGLFDEEAGIEERVQIEDEPFISSYPLDWRLKMRPLHQWLDSVFNRPQSTENHRPPDHLFEMAYADYYRRGATPENEFAMVDKAALKAELTMIQSMITPLINRVKSAQETLSAAIIGTPVNPPGDITGRLTDRRIIRFDPLSVPITYRTVEDSLITCQAFLHGQISWMWREKESGWHALVPTGIRRLTKKPRKHLLNPILFYLSCLTAKNTRAWIGESPLTLHLASAQNLAEFTFQADNNDAVSYLLYLMIARLEDYHSLWMPFETMSRLAVNPLIIDPAAVDSTLRARFRDEVIEAFAKEADDLECLIDPVFSKDLLDRAMERFQIFGKLRLSKLSPIR